MPQMRWRALGWSAVVFAIAFRDVVPRAKHAGSMQLLFAEAFPMTSMSSARRSRIMCATYSKNVDDDVGVDAIASAPPTPIIDQEGRQWRSSAQLASQNLVRDGLSDLEVLAADNESLQSPPTPFTLRQHSLLLRGAEEKGRFVNDDERWSYRYDALCKFQERYGHTCVPFNWGMLVDKRHTAGDVPKSDGLDYDNGEEPALLSATSGENSFDDERKRSNESKRSRDNIQLSSEFAEPYLRLELGYWVAQQRKYYKQRIRGDIVAGQRLTPERIEYLNKLDFIWDVKEARWETQYMQLREFVQNNGHACVNQNSTLGQWCYRQRQHRRNIDNGLTVDWASIPERAYMPILLNETQDVSMILAEDRVVETAAGGKEYKGRPVSPLTPERMERLEALGFIWDVREQAWEDQFQSLRQYQLKHGATRVPQNGKLGVWVKKQREAWRSQQKSGDSLVGMGTYALTPERIAKLDSINFSWSGHEHSWEDHYQHLIQYKEEHNNLHISQKLDNEKYPKLGQWLTTQRSEYRKGNLSLERRDRLEQAGVNWDPLLSQFCSRVDQLRQYKSEYGTLRVKSVHDKPLYSWVRKMAKEYEAYNEKKKSSLHDDTRRRMLDELCFKEELLGTIR